MKLTGIEEMAMRIAGSMGIEYRAFAETTASDEFVTVVGKRAEETITRDLAYHLAETVITIASRSQKPETRVERNVPQRTGKTEYRAELVAFNPKEFAEFLHEFAIEAIDIWLRGESERNAEEE